MVKANFYYPFNSHFMSTNSNYPIMSSAPPPSQNIPNQSNENYGMYHPPMNMTEMGTYPNNYQNMPEPNPYFPHHYPQIKMEEGFGSANREDTFSQNATQKEEVPQKRKYGKEKMTD